MPEVSYPNLFVTKRFAPGVSYRARYFRLWLGLVLAFRLGVRVRVRGSCQGQRRLEYETPRCEKVRVRNVSKPYIMMTVWNVHSPFSRQNFSNQFINYNNKTRSTSSWNDNRSEEWKDLRLIEESWSQINARWRRRQRTDSVLRPINGDDQVVDERAVRRRARIAAVRPHHASTGTALGRPISGANRVTTSCHWQQCHPAHPPRPTITALRLTWRHLITY